MKAFIPYFGLIIILQLWACASQSDSFSTQEKSTTKGLKDRSTTADEVEEVLEEDEAKSEGDSEVEENKTITTTKGIGKEDGKPKIKGNALGGSKSGGGVHTEDRVEALSVISYSNIIESAAAAELPVQGQKVKLMIKNNHQQAMWYLMPVSGEKTMPDDGQFNVNLDAIPPFLAKQYGTNNSKLIELIFHGAKGQGFRAFYIEAGSSFLFRNYDLGTYQEGEYVPFWAIKGLEVNNEANLEEWLPFSVISSPDVVIQNTTESGTNKWLDVGKNAVFPKPNIKFIQANDIKKYQIPVGVIR